MSKSKQAKGKVPSTDQVDVETARAVGGLVTQLSSILNANTVGLTALASLVCERCNISVNDLAARTGEIMDILQTPEGQKSNMIQLISSAMKKTVIEK